MRRPKTRIGGSRHAIGILLSALAGAALTGGCQSSGAADSAGPDRGQGRELFSGQGRGDRGAEAGRGSAWSVFIVGLHKPANASEAVLAEVREEAAIALHQVRTEGGLPQAYLEETPRQVAILYGQYSTPDSPRAQADLRRIKQMEIGGGRPFGGAVLRPPAGTDAGGMPEYDLRNVRDYYGPRVRYTLQVGIYGREDNRAPTASELAEFRRAAERAVLELRREGEPAFYYHGPFRSTVTVGALAEDEAFIVIDRESGAKRRSGIVEDLMRRHPNNLFNGAAVRERVGGGGWRLQASRLVAIPE